MSSLDEVVKKLKKETLDIVEEEINEEEVKQEAEETSKVKYVKRWTTRNYVNPGRAELSGGVPTAKQ